MTLWGVGGTSGSSASASVVVVVVICGALEGLALEEGIDVGCDVVVP